ncbi:MAG: VOC family protein [Ignavibacteria bacterium]|nr:VOC family protein [Ignavibacteria bacterium]
MDIAHNVIGWIEIPVTDMERAMKFYEAVFGFAFTRQQMGDLDMAFFPWVKDSEGAGGALVCSAEHYTPMANGTLAYFTAFSGDLAIELARAEAAGGTILMPKTLIAEGVGHMGLFLDSEGNRIALHTA